MQIGTPLKRGCDANTVDMNFSFPCTTTVGTTQIDRAERGLSSGTVTYAATGQYQVKLPVGTTFPINQSVLNAGGLPVTVQVTPQWTNIAGAFNAMPVGEITYVGGQIVFNIQTTNASFAAAAPAAAAGARINVMIVGINSAGK